MLIELLKTMVEKGASDLHLGAGAPPTLRIDGRLQPLSLAPLSAEQTKVCCYEMLTQEQIQRLERDRELDLSFSVKNEARFRANFFWQKNSIAGAFRHIPLRIPELDKLGLPPSVQALADKPHGLILVTGTTGSGKSTTLAAMIQAMNRVRPWHIMTVEYPIEFVFESQKSLIHQREVGQDTASFSQGLKYVLREDPDVVMVGEMRDLETIAAALTIAETGHLVLTTLHTNTAMQAVERIIDVFPAHQQDQVRVQLSFTLQGILSQQLLPKVDGGRCLALEILLPNSAIRNLIRENKIHQIYSQMQMGQTETGMQTMNQSLSALIKKGWIVKEEALRHSPDPEELAKLL